MSKTGYKEDNSETEGNIADEFLAIVKLLALNIW